MSDKSIPESCITITWTLGAYLSGFTKMGAAWTIMGIAVESYLLSTGREVAEAPKRPIKKKVTVMEVPQKGKGPSVAAFELSAESLTASNASGGSPELSNRKLRKLQRQMNAEANALLYPGAERRQVSVAMRIKKQMTRFGNWWKGGAQLIPKDQLEYRIVQSAAGGHLL